MIMSLFLLTCVSAFDFDNSLKYSNNDLKVDVINAFGLGEDLGSAELKSHKSVDEILRFTAGNKVTMFYELDFKDIYENGLGEVTFIDRRTGKEIKKDYEFVYWSETEKEICNDLNGTQKCFLTKERGWLPYDSKDIPKGKIKIGIKTFVDWNDWIDGQWTLAGKKVKKHADWGSLNINYDNYEIFNVSGNDTFSVPDITQVAVLIIGGGGGGGYVTTGSNQRSGGGGAGELIFNESYPVTPSSTINLYVGVGGHNQGNGTSSYFDGVEAIGGGAGGGDSKKVGDSGGSAGGGYCDTSTGYNGGTAINDIGLGNDGANGQASTRGGGGGGSGGSASAQTGGAGTTIWGLDWARGGHGGVNNNTVYHAENNTGNGGGGVQGGSTKYGGDGGIGVIIVAWNTTDNYPIVTLNSPANNTNFSVSSVTFNCTASDDIKLSNVTLKINETNNGTDSSGINNSNYIFSRVFNDGSYNWSCSASDNASHITTAPYRYFSIDANNPIVNITSPTTEDHITNYTNSTNATIEFNITFSDLNLDTCLINYNGTNQTIVCNTNQTISLPWGTHSFYAYANDTFGHWGSDSVTATWEYRVFEINKTFENETVEGNSEDFYLYVMEGSGYNIQSIVLHYNTTSDTSSLFSSGDNVTAISDIIIPSVSADTNITFYFTITMSDSVAFNSTTATQLIRNVAVDDCSVQPNLFMVLNLVDEENQSLITGDIEVYLSITNPVTSQEVLSINATYEGVQNKSFCSDPPLNQTGYLLEAEIRYSADNYSAEFYNLQNSNLANYPKTYNLYDLKEEDTTKFKLIYQGEDLVGVEGAIIQLQRKYISEGVYKIVEAPLTSSDSTAVVHIDTNTNRYKATVVKNGILLNTFENLVFICQSELTGECTLDLTDYIVPPNSVSVESLQDFSYSIDTTEDGVIDLIYSVPSGTTSTIQVVATQQDIIGTETICNTTVSSAGGSIECTYTDSIQDSYIDYKVYKDGTPKAEKSYIVKDDLRADFSGVNYFILFIFGLSLIFMALTSPEWIILNSILTIIVGGATWLLRGMDFVLGLGAIAWLILGAVIIFMKMQKQEDH